MRVNGIVAEYNPFHNGHLYHLSESKRLTGADYTIVVMSGNFVQRGAPALTDKFLRANMALSCGADLVVELPALYATASAEYFAAGAVSLLDKLGVVTHLCFGSENGDLDLLGRVARILAKEPEGYLNSLKRSLGRGLSYPGAREDALLENYPFLAEHKDVFSAPNNILAIEYLKALLRQESPIIPFSLRRTGSGYLDQTTDGAFNSALAIRQALYSGAGEEVLAGNLPPEPARLLSQALKSTGPVRSQDFSDMVYYKLLAEKDQGFEEYLDVSRELSARICRQLNRYSSLESFCGLLKTREMTYARISRSLFHILLNIRKEDMERARKSGLTPYARVLGFRRNAAPLKKKSRPGRACPFW